MLSEHVINSIKMIFIGEGLNETPTLPPADGSPRQQSRRKSNIWDRSIKWDLLKSQLPCYNKWGSWWCKYPAERSTNDIKITNFLFTPTCFYIQLTFMWGRRFPETPSLHPSLFPLLSIWGHRISWNVFWEMNRAALNMWRLISSWEGKGFVFTHFRILRSSKATWEIPTLAYFILKFKADGTKVLRLWYHLGEPFFINGS